MSNVKVNTINDANGGSNAILYGVAAPANSMGFRNRIINGDMRVAQRGNIAAVSGVWTYGGCDRTAVLPVSFTTATGTISQAAGYGSAGYAQSVALTTTGSGSVNFEQRIESLNTYDLSSVAVTVTVRVYQNTGSPLNVTQTVTKANAKDNFTSKTTLGVSTPVSVPSGVVTELLFTLSLGASDAANGLSAQVNFAGVGAVTTKSFLVTDWQLEAGSVASPFERVNYTGQLAMCQRYCYVVTTAQTQVPLCMVANYGSTNAYGVLPFPVPMRATPTATFVNSTNWNVTASATVYVSTIGQGNATPFSTEIYTSSTGLVNGAAGWIRSNSGSTNQVINSAEL